MYTRHLWEDVYVLHFTFGGIAIRQPYASICQYPAFVANDSIKTKNKSCDWGTYPAEKKINVHHCTSMYIQLILMGIYPIMIL